jgi:hypothetical protein
LNVTDAAAVAGHYGSISAVTFVAVTGVLVQLSIPYDGYLVAVAAAMETPAIFAALLIARRISEPGDRIANGHFLREVAFNGSIVILIGARTGHANIPKKTHRRYCGGSAHATDH